ncbi:outer membrane protein assembly factor BamA [uncultured Treponema sp.]|uniref:outer membrane protein assembly factor BamA n=1 Tax=uncultured Treponema sp. TaxID=162155 RepID=UPI0015BE9A62|nr:outer membrane protein assembly factor BamA [uncultured Treponema sp.]
MSFKRLKFAFLFCVAVCAVFPSVFYAQEDTGVTAETDDNWFYGKLIKSISFKNLKSVDAKELEGVTGSFIGRRFSDEVFGDILDRIYALDFFDEVTPQAIPGDAKKNTVSIVFSVTERPVVTRITFSGNRQIRTTELKEAVSLKEKDIFVESKMLVDERAVRDVYLGKGFTNVRVTASSKDTAKGVEVNFKVDEGRSTVIAKLDFRGNKVVSGRTLKNKLTLKEAGLINKGAFQESELEADKQAIAAYYQNLGYIDAEVIDVVKEVSINEKKNRDELTITFVIVEGSQYTFGGINFKGNIIFSSDKLNSYVKLKTGSVYSQQKYQESVMAIADLYYENGYTSNRFQPVPNKDVNNKVISYDFFITESVRSHVESISIKGNTRTREDIIRREIPIESGDIFSKAKLTTGLRNLYNLQFFSAVVPDVVPGSEENLVNLVFSVDEQSTTSIEFGVTFSGVSDPDDLPFALFVKWQDSNLRGTGKSISASSTIATDEQSVSLSFGENWLFGKPISSSINTSFSHSQNTALMLEQTDFDDYPNSDDYYMEYERWVWTLGFSLGRRWTPVWAILSLSAGINGSLINNIYDEVNTPVDLTIVDYSNEWGWQNSIWASFSIDDRDINYDPSKGWFASQRLTWYGLMPFENEFFLRSDTKAEKYFTLFNLPVTETWNWKMVFAAYSGLSVLIPAYNSGIGNSSKVYIDGMFNARGWTNIYNKHRGKALWSNILELRMPIVPGVLAVDWFGDAAVIADSPYDLFNNTGISDFYFSTGPGLRFSIPQFPLRLLFANTFKIDEDYNLTWDNNWKFVLSFNITNK